MQGDGVDILAVGEGPRDGVHVEGKPHGADDQLSRAVAGNGIARRDPGVGIGDTAGQRIVEVGLIPWVGPSIIDRAAGRAEDHLHRLGVIDRRARPEAAIGITVDDAGLVQRGDIVVEPGVRFNVRESRRRADRQHRGPKAHEEGHRRQPARTDRVHGHVVSFIIQENLRTEACRRFSQNAR